MVRNRIDCGLGSIRRPCRQQALEDLQTKALQYCIHERDGRLYSCAPEHRRLHRIHKPSSVVAARVGRTRCRLPTSSSVGSRPSVHRRRRPRRRFVSPPAWRPCSPSCSTSSRRHSCPVTRRPLTGARLQLVRLLVADLHWTARNAGGGGREQKSQYAGHHSAATALVHPPLY